MIFSILSSTCLGLWLPLFDKGVAPILDKHLLTAAIASGTSRYGSVHPLEENHTVHETSKLFQYSDSFASFFLHKSHILDPIEMSAFFTHPLFD